MKKNLLKTITVVFIIGIAYTLFFSVEKMDAGRIGVVQDLRSKTVVRIVRPVVGSYAFVWQGAFPWWFSISEIPGQRAAGIKVKIDLPELGFLKEDYYHLWVPLRVVYRINAGKFSDIARLDGDGSALDELVNSIFRDELQREMNPFLAPAYQREALAGQMEQIMARVMKNLDDDFKSYGIEVLSAKISGTMVLPDRGVYNEGVLHAADLRKMDRMKEMEIIGVRGAIEREKIKNEQFYANLQKISTIISANPDILKYIYIDKLGGNVNVILSSDSIGVPRMLEKTDKPVKGKSKEIDNLR